MDIALKQRLVGAAVLVALAVIFLPMLVQGPAPESGMSDVPLDLPGAPAGEYETRDIPLVAPAPAGATAVTGMDLPNPDAAELADTASVAEPMDEANDDAAQVATEPLADEPAPTPAPTEMFPAATAGGDYAVNFGSFSTQAAADRIVTQLRTSQLPGYREAATVDGRRVYRVRIGPYASRAQAEAARLRAAHVRDDVGARVVALDAAEPAAEPAAAKPVVANPSKPPEPAKPVVAAPKPASPTPPAAASTGFAVQVGAFSKPADAAALRDKLRAAGFTVFTEAVNTDKGTLTRVRVGPVLARSEADQLKQQVRTKVGIDGIVRPHP